MRRIGLALVGLLVFVVFFVNAEAGVKIIRGYASGEFAVKGLIETQVSELVNEIKNDFIRKPNMDLQIFIEGFADRTGLSSENDRIAKERAEGIAAVLSREFPKAKIDFVSRGDKINRREVTVRWKYFSIPVAPAQETEANVKEVFSIRRWAIAIVIIIVVVTLFTVWFHHKLVKGKPEPQSGKRWLNVSLTEGKFQVQVELNKDGKFISPFKSKSNSIIVRDTLKGMVDSLKGCLTKEEFMRQGQELLAKGKIRKL